MSLSSSTSIEQSMNSNFSDNENAAAMLQTSNPTPANVGLGSGVLNPPFRSNPEGRPYPASFTKPLPSSGTFTANMNIVTIFKRTVKLWDFNNSQVSVYQNFSILL